MHLLHMNERIWRGLIGWAGLLAVLAGGCDNTTGQGGGLFRDPQAGGERWTIRCARLETPNHQEKANLLAGLLGKVQGLKAANVRVASDATGSVIHYGQYVKVASPSGSLVFPPQFQRDIELIRSLAYGQETPFFYAAPEPMIPAGPGGATGAVGEASTARGTHSLLIAVFYNTPTFTERRQAAEEYVAELRKQGYPAYYHHEPVRSLVYVGDFDASDLVVNRDRRIVYGPRVEQLIARNPEEFKHQTENGHLLKRSMPDGTVITPPSVLVPLPGRAGATEDNAALRPMPPAGG